MEILRNIIPNLRNRRFVFELALVLSECGNIRVQLDSLGAEINSRVTLHKSDGLIPLRRELKLQELSICGRAREPSPKPRGVRPQQIVNRS
jgi:hypothetical protein